MITFRSFYQAVLIIAMIPLGWFGAILGHGIEDWISPAKELPVSLLSVWGMVALSGVIINDAVVFLAKFNNLVKEEGMTVYQAAYNAGLSRFRPIVLTSLTTVLGFISTDKRNKLSSAISDSNGDFCGLRGIDRYLHHLALFPCPDHHF